MLAAGNLVSFSHLYIYANGGHVLNAECDALKRIYWDASQTFMIFCKVQGTALLE